MTASMQRLVDVLVDPARGKALDGAAWTELLACARAEALAGTLAERCASVDLPPPVAAALADLRADYAQQQRLALWEA